MEFDKSQILDLLKNNGKHDEAHQADNTLPEKVDTDNPEHKDILSKLGLNLDDLKGKLGGLGKIL